MINKDEKVAALNPLIGPPYVRPEELFGVAGDTGLTIGAIYTDGTRRMICMTDHATKGIWLNGLTSAGEGDAFWCGTRDEFDSSGWKICESAWHAVIHSRTGRGIK
jgi:hypothetical protein